jgi:hypothetical protein
MIKIGDARWREIVALTRQLMAVPNYRDAVTLAKLIQTIDATQPLRAKPNGSDFVICTDLATGSPVTVNKQETPLDDLILE